MLSKIFRTKLSFIALLVLFAILIASPITQLISLGEDTIPPAVPDKPPLSVTPANTTPETTPAPNTVTKQTDNTAKTPPTENIIYIPYDKFKHNFGVKDGGVFVPYDEYKKLLETAQKNQEDTKPQSTPIDALITEMSGTVKVSDDVVQVESTLDIELLKDGWHEIPIALGDTAITKADINGESAKITGNPQSGYKLIVEKKKNEKTQNKNKNEIIPQRLKLNLQFAKGIAKSPGQNSVSFLIPQTPLSRWTVIIPESDVKINFTPSVAAATDKKEKNPKQTVLHAFVGTVPEIQIAWTPKAEGATGLEALISTQILQQTTIDEGIYRTTVECEYTISRASIANLAIKIPADQKVVRVIDSNIKKWEVESKDNVQIIKIDLFEPAKEKQLVRFELEKLFDFKEQQNSNDKSKNSVKLNIPEIAAIGAGRQQGVLITRSTNELSCETINSTGLLRMDFTELPQQLQRTKWDAAFRITSATYNLEVAVNKVKPRITVTSQAIVRLNNHHLKLENALLFNIEQAGLFQLKLHVPTTFKDYAVHAFNTTSFVSAQIDSFHIEAIKGNDKFKLMTIALSKKAFGKVILQISGYQHNENIINKKTGEIFDLSVQLPTVPPEFAEQFTGKLLLQVNDAFRINPIEPEGIQPVSIQQITEKDWLMSTSQARSGFLFLQDTVAFKIQAEKRKPQLTLKKLHHVRVESGAVKHNITINYEVQFSELNSIRIDLPEQISGRINLNRTNSTNSANNNWRDSKIVPPPDDVEKGYVAWEFSRGDKIRGNGKFDLNWDDVIEQPDVGKTIRIIVPRLIPQKQQPADRIWGQIIVSKSESVDLGESEQSHGLKPIDPQNDIDEKNRVKDAVAAFEFYDKWLLELDATRYKLEEVKRTSIEKGIVRANIFFSKKGAGISAQALFKIRSVQQRLEMTINESAKISEVRINNRRVALEADSTAKYMIPLTSITPDTPFLLDVRYTVEPPSKNKIIIPTFPANNPESSKTSGAAIQKANLSVFVPDKYFIVGYRGNWSKEFSYKKQNFHDDSFLIINKPIQNEITLLLNEFSVPRDDFQIAGDEYQFNAIHPDNNTSLTVNIVSTKTGSIIFALLILYGILTIKIPCVKWTQISLAIIIVCVFAGFILTTFTEYLATLSAVYWGIGIILICRLLNFLFSLRKKNNTTAEAETTTDSNNNSNNNIVTNNQEGEQHNEN
ncbi:MAG: hypothetical protein LBT09_02940 [Planctomycetaceae bacterium]|jgi:hypothetical protein|nr:hypothetical protein [Planctomycetaceae bacterium]